MKNTTKSLTVTMAIAILLSSCTMQKRLYTHGYYIESTVGINSPLKSEPSKNANKIESAPKKNDGVQAAIVTPKELIGATSILKEETGKTKKQIPQTRALSNVKISNNQIESKAASLNNLDNAATASANNQSTASQDSGDASKNWAAILGFILAFFFPLLGLIFSIIGLPSEHHGL